MHVSRRGRPRSDRPRHDYGTPELVLKRLSLSPQDATQSTTPLDVAHARGLISDEAHSAAVYFNALRKIVFGKAHPPAIDLTAISSVGSTPDELDRADAESKYREACAAMKCQSRQALDAVENVVVHERWQDWMFPKAGRHDAVGQRHFGLGIAALLGWYRGRQRKPA